MLAETKKAANFLAFSEVNIKFLGKKLFPLRKVINSDNFSPSNELQTHIARVTCSDVYSLDKLRKVERLNPRYRGEGDNVTAAVIMSIILEMVMNDPFPATDIDTIFQVLTDDKTNEDILCE